MKDGSVGAAYRETVGDAVALYEDVLERRCCVGERLPKSVCPIALTLTSKRWRRRVEISSIARSEELLNDVRGPSAAHSLEETPDQRLVCFG